MKRANNLLPLIADIDNLRLAFWKASKGKRYADNVLTYQACLDKNLLLLRTQILSGEVSVGNYHYFKIYEPKERQICAAIFSEQVLHHALMNICHPYFERVQIFDSYASRVGKGTHKAIDRAQYYAQRYKCFLKLDVRKFFDSITHEVVKKQLYNLFKEKKLLLIFNEIIDSYSTTAGRGVPIGNLTSQYFANHYLAYLDHFIKEEIKCKGYVRYMDDMLLFHQDKATLKIWQKSITHYLQQNLGNQLKPTLLNYTNRGIPFLGYAIFPTYLRLLHKSKIRFIRKYKKAEQELAEGKISQKEYQEKILPLLSFIDKIKHKKFRKSVILPV
ncbi:MAG: RNA-directed DNA polymerase [Bernardetiaceae bacterium]|nr:RNA-directed DNA polymerase [Bernardetiaceae bacterium]